MSLVLCDVSNRVSRSRESSAGDMSNRVSRSRESSAGGVSNKSEL